MSLLCHVVSERHQSGVRHVDVNAYVVAPAGVDGSAGQGNPERQPDRACFGGHRNYLPNLGNHDGWGVSSRHILNAHDQRSGWLEYFSVR